MPPKRCAKCKAPGWNSGKRIESVIEDEPDPEREEVARQVRADKKAARSERKAVVAKSVAAALPVRPHTFHSGAAPIPGCDDCAVMAREFKGVK